MTYYLDRLVDNEEFRFDKLVLTDIDNTSVVEVYGSGIRAQETCLFHQDMSGGDEYFEILHNFIDEGLQTGSAAPIVRFADGEYAFYRFSLECNSLYQQAESVKAIKTAMPMHIEALRILSLSGKIAPLIYPDNVQTKRKDYFSFFRKAKSDDGALEFLELLFRNKIELKKDRYVPFYAVYAYLTSGRFCEIVDDKKLCIISSECNIDSCSQWFERFSSHPNVSFTQIPDSYMATQWHSIREDTLAKIPSDVDLCLVGAGIGSILVCVDVSHAFSVPAIDAGHVLNMMNGREDKSSGPRLYTIHRN